MKFVAHFNQDDLLLCNRIATSRNDSKLRAGIGRHGTYDGILDTFAMHYDNVRAEMAVTKVLGQGDLDTTVYVRGNKQGNIILLYEGEPYRAFARYRRKRGWNLALKSTDIKHFYGAVGFLVWPLEKHHPTQSLEVMGWTTRAEFEQKAHVESFLKGQPRLVMPLRELHRMTDPVRPIVEPIPEQGVLL